MKYLLIALFFIGSLSVSAQSNETKTEEPAEKVVEISCGQCQFHMEEKGCDLAVRIDGKDYYVDGVDMDDLGDAHGHDGMCNMIREAKVVGELINGRFVASSIKMLPHKH